MYKLVKFSDNFQELMIINVFIYIIDIQETSLEKFELERNKSQDDI